MNIRKRMAVELVDNLFYINLFLQRAGNRQVAEFGLNQSQFAVLREIADHRDLSQKDILGDFLLEKSNLSKIIKKLEQMKLINIDVCSHDRRKMVLNATEEGKERCHDCLKKLQSMKATFTESLNDEELESSLTAIRQLAKIAKEYKQSTENKQR